MTAIDLHIAKIVQDVNIVALDADGLFGGQRIRPRAEVNIAANNRERGNRAQGRKDLGAAHIARVNDMSHALHCRERLRP
jgi:hypothetical protein